jgi:hypothetical protein
MQEKHILPTPNNMHIWAWRGVITFAVLFTLGWLVFATYITNPVEETEDRVVDPLVAFLPIGIDDPIQVCPDGWQDVSNTDIHIQNLSCFLDENPGDGVGGWLVVLNRAPDGDGFLCSHAYQDDTPGAINVFCDHSDQFETGWYVENPDGTRVMHFGVPGWPSE